MHYSFILEISGTRYSLEELTSLLLTSQNKKGPPRTLCAPAIRQLEKVTKPNGLRTNENFINNLYPAFDWLNSEELSISSKFFRYFHWFVVTDLIAFGL